MEFSLNVIELGILLIIVIILFFYSKKTFLYTIFLTIIIDIIFIVYILIFTSIKYYTIGSFLFELTHNVRNNITF